MKIMKRKRKRGHSGKMEIGNSCFKCKECGKSYIILIDVEKLDKIIFSKKYGITYRSKQKNISK
jgi:hypothetical protein